VRRLTRLLGVAAVIVVVAAGCSGSGEDRAAASSWERQTLEVGRVEVQATPLTVDDRGIEIRLVFDTHTVTLDTDIPSAAWLVARDTEHRDGIWVGDGPGGHHREGVLRFPDAQPGEGGFELRLDGFDEPIAFRWPS
jgi:hypothetical protein